MHDPAKFLQYQTRILNEIAYSDEHGTILPTFYQALAMYCWTWSIPSALFVVAAVRSSWPLFLTLFGFTIELVLLAVGYMTGKDGVLSAAFIIGFFVAFGGCELFLLRIPYLSSY